MLSKLAYSLDPVLFAEHVLGFKPFPGQEEILRSEAKRIVLNCSRQYGKTTLAAIKALWYALYNPESLILIVARAERQSQELLRKTRGMGLLVEDVSYTNESKTHVELNNGSRVISLPQSSSGIRGFSDPDIVIVDEASRVEDETFVALKPMLMGGGTMIQLSTPHGKRGFYHRCWTKDTTWEKHQVNVYDNPRATPEFIEAEKGSMSDYHFREEYCCEFLDLQGQIIGSDYIEKAFDSSVQPLFRQHGKEKHVPVNILDEKIKPIM